MDKRNYTIKEVDWQGIRKETEKIRHKIIRALSRNSIIKRKRVVKDYSILVQAAYLYIVERLSYQRLSDTMACKYGICMSDTAWKKQLEKIAPIFMEIAEKHMEACSLKALPAIKNGLLNHREAYAIDATDISQEGDHNVVMRIHTQLSLNDHASIQMKITDNHTGENVKHLPLHAHGLYVADRAYGKAQQIAHMFQNKADFIIRITPRSVQLYTDATCKERVDFRSLVAEKSFSVPAFLKYGKIVYPVRVIGEELPAEKQVRSEKRTRRKAKKNQAKIQESTLLYSKWMIVVSSLSPSVSAREILDAYRQRWQIELLFKRSKTLLGLKKMPFSTSLFKNTFLKLWVSVVLILSALQLSCFFLSGILISEFNSFSILKNYLP